MNLDEASVCYLNGKFLPLAEAKISVLDRGFIFGDAVYEVIPVSSGTLLFIDKHLARFARSLAEIGIINPLAVDEWRACLEQLVALNNVAQCSIYVQVSRGVAVRDHAAPAGIVPTIFAMCRPMHVPSQPSRVRAITMVDPRWARCDIKSTSLLPNVLLRNQAVAKGVDEVLLVRDGLVTEGAASNVFVVSSGQVKTPPLSEKILAGVTRSEILDALSRLGTPVSEEDISPAQLREAEEIWITSSTRETACVYELDGHVIGDGNSYPIAARVYAHMQDHKRQFVTSGA